VVSTFFTRAVLCSYRRITNERVLNSFNQLKTTVRDYVGEALEGLILSGVGYSDALVGSRICLRKSSQFGQVLAELL